MPNLFKRARPSLAPDVVYPSRLADLYQGHALWYPESHNTGEPQIGDVGYMSGGSFIRLFSLNSSLKPEQQVTFWPTPFTPAQLDPGVFEQLDKREALRPDHYLSHGVYRRKLSGAANVTAGPYASVGMNVEHTCTESQGAVLIIKSPALRESILRREPLQQYMRAHYREWYAYTKTLGLGIDREEISLVMGWAKTSADWKAVAFTRSSTGYQASLQAGAMGTANVKVHGETTHETEPPKVHREGALYSRAHADSPASGTSKSTPKHRKPKASKRRKPADSDPDSSKPGHTTNTSNPPGSASIGDGEAKKDQCIFLKRCMIKGRILPIVAGAGPHRLPRQEDRRSGNAREGLMVEQEDEEDYEHEVLSYASKGITADPLDTLLGYIFEVSGADTAIASDNDIESLVCGEHIVDFATYLRRVQPPVEVDGTVGSISIPEMISRDQERAVARRSIAPSDIYKWPGLSFDDASILETGKLFIGSTDADTHPLISKHFVFTDSLSDTGRCLCYAISSDGTLIAASFKTETVLVWRLSDGLQVQRLHDQGHTDEINSVAFAPSNQHLVSVSDDDTAIIWDIASGRVLWRLEGHRGAVRRVAYSPDGSRIATGSDSEDGSVKIWDASSGQCLRFLCFGERVDKLIFSPDGAQLIVELEHTGAICDAHTGTVNSTLQHEDGEQMRLSLSHQGDRIIAGTIDGKVTIWSTMTGEELLQFDEHTAKISYAAFSPDSAEVVTASRDHTVITCDSQTGQIRHAYQMPTGVWSAAYSPNGDYLAMGDGDGRIRVRDAKSGMFLAEFGGHGGALDELRFLPDGHSLLSHCDEDATVRLWSVRDAMRLR